LSEAFVSPGFVDVTGVDVADEELFAPLLQVRRVASFDEAIAAANATRYGLSAGLISNESDHWDQVPESHPRRRGQLEPADHGRGREHAVRRVWASGNHRPSAYYAADYCAYPVASFEAMRCQYLSAISRACAHESQRSKPIATAWSGRPIPMSVCRPATWPARRTPARSPIRAARRWKACRRCAGWPTGACRNSPCRRMSDRT
jgi:hypothetical protein